MILRKLSLAVMASMVIAAPVFGRAFYSATNSAAFMATSGASMTVTRSADVAANNPASMVRLKPGQYVTGGASIVETEYLWEGQNSKGGFASETTRNPQLLAPHFDYVYRPATGKFAYGFAMKLPYNNILSWDSGWEGRERVIDARIMTVSFNPVIAYEINENNSIGFGINFAPSRFIAKARQPLDTGNYRINTEGLAVYFNAAYSGNMENIFYAVQYNSTMPMKLTGTMKFSTHNNPLLDKGGAIELVDSDATIEFQLPWVIEASIGWKDSVKNPKLELEAGVFRMGWSVYNKQVITLEDPSPGLAATTKYGDRISIPNHYYDSNNYRAGMNYHLTDRAIFMTGLERDQRSIRSKYLDPGVPLGGETNIAIGMEFKMTDDKSMGVEANVSLWDRITTDNTVSIVDSGTGGRPFHGTYQGTSRVATVTYNQRF